MPGTRILFHIQLGNISGAPSCITHLTEHIRYFSTDRIIDTSTIRYSLPPGSWTTR